jgi:hypothetical protein
MTNVHIRQCPRCELRFTSSSELEHHLIEDHRPRRSTADQSPAAPATVPTPQRLSRESARTDVIPPQRLSRDSARTDVIPPPRSHVPVWLIAVTALVLVLAMVSFAPTLTAAITTALIVVMASGFWWRARIRARMPR